MRTIRGVLDVFLLIAATLALAGCGDRQGNIFPGYMEAHLVMVGSEQGGRVETLAVEEGDSVEPVMNPARMSSSIDSPPVPVWWKTSTS